jgi:hypothetical protein
VLRKLSINLCVLFGLLLGLSNFGGAEPSARAAGSAQSELKKIDKELNSFVKSKKKKKKKKHHKKKSKDKKKKHKKHKKYKKHHKKKKKTTAMSELKELDKQLNSFLRQ